MKKKRKRFWVIFIIIFFIALIPLIKCLLTDQMQHLIKKSLMVKVAAGQTELNEAIAEMKNQDLPDVIRRTKTDGESNGESDNEIITKVFNEFPVAYIRNEMDNSECGYIFFNTSSSLVDLVPRNCIYGFYYSEEDKPLDIFGRNCIASNTKVEVDLSLYNMYWCWTEKITDNWWYYEAHFTSNNNAWK